MKNSFILNYGVHLWIASIGITGPFGALLAFGAKLILGDMAERGIIILDIHIDRLKEAMKSERWKADASRIFNETISKVQTEQEKEVIRAEYLRILSRYATFDGVPNN